MEKQSADGTVVDGNGVSLSFGLWGRCSFGKAAAFSANAGAGQLYRRFPDAAGRAASLVLDGIGGRISFGDGVFWFSFRGADVPSGGKQKKNLALGRSGGDVCCIVPAGKSFGGVSFAPKSGPVAASGLSGHCTDFITDFFRERGQEKCSVKN